MNLKKFFTFQIVLLLMLTAAFAIESHDGDIRLLLHERTASFSAYSLVDPAQTIYESFLYSRDPSTSYLSVNVNGRVHRLGSSRDFATSYGLIDGSPAITFESSSLLINQIFTPVKTSNSLNVNGLEIKITVLNKSQEELQFGLRILLDTHIGEESGNIPFFTGSRQIDREYIIQSSSQDKYWLTSGQNITLMGSIVNPLDRNARVPDFIHIANWKRLNDVPWKLNYLEGRNFSDFPYSINDSAVCYFYEPQAINAGETFTYSVFLTTEDKLWYSSGIFALQTAEHLISQIPPVAQPPQVSDVYQDPVEARRNEQLQQLIMLQNTLELFIAGEIQLTEQDLHDIEMVILSLRFDLYGF